MVHLVAKQDAARPGAQNVAALVKTAKETRESMANAKPVKQAKKQSKTNAAAKSKEDPKKQKKRSDRSPRELALAPVLGLNMRRLK